MLPAHKILQGALVEIDTIAPRCTSEQLENLKFNRDSVLNWIDASRSAELAPVSFPVSISLDLEVNHTVELIQTEVLNLVSGSPTAPLDTHSDNLPRRAVTTNCMYSFMNAPLAGRSESTEADLDSSSRQNSLVAQCHITYEYGIQSTEGWWASQKPP
ncbi:hypothetical protein R1flu_028557 [Riccia fluitans]|uniref:Uncharacterized protein n=1 Tax=Riccia fluitans TaxID=41844 RepID=A0ABD1XM14_9MARC